MTPRGTTKDDIFKGALSRTFTDYMAEHPHDYNIFDMFPKTYGGKKGILGAKVDDALDRAVWSEDQED